MSSIKGEKFEMRLGLPGASKTLCQTELGVLPDLIDGLDVWANYWINWNLPNLHIYQEFEDVLHVRNCVVVCDEIGAILEPRNWDNEDTGVRKFFQQHRKRHVDIMGSTQHVSLIAKSALIVVSDFKMCFKTFDSPLFANWPWVVAHEQSMTLREVKLEDSEFSPFNEYEDFQLGSSKSHWFSKKKLLHRELDEFKIELVHHYCPECCQRQEPQIKKEETPLFADFLPRSKEWVERPDRPVFYCPKHRQQQLEVRESAMYDTDYEIQVPEREVVFRPYYKTLKEAPYRGSLSAAQMAVKRALEGRNG